MSLPDQPTPSLPSFQVTPSTERVSCPRCGFTVDFTGASERFRKRRGEEMEFHLTYCGDGVHYVNKAEVRAIRRENAWAAQLEKWRREREAGA